MHADSDSSGRPPFGDRAFEALREWPVLQAGAADTGTGMALAVGALQIVHLHRPCEAELRLTWPVIQRLSGILGQLPQARFEPGDDWVRLRLEDATEVTTLLSLVSVAVKANGPAARQRDAQPATPCPHARFTATRIEPASAVPSDPGRHPATCSPGPLPRRPGRGRAGSRG